jgi:hypothetical protein
MALFDVRIPAVHRACAGLAVWIALVSCNAMDVDDVGPDADEAADIQSSDAFGLWTGAKRLPYRVGGPAVSRRVVELAPGSSGPITMVAALRWRDHSAGAVNPQVNIGLASARGESTLLHVFESDGVLRAGVDLAMTDVLEVGVWYRVVLTISEAPGRLVQATIFDENAVEVWRSCGDGATRCPSAPIDAHDLQSLRVTITVDDVRQGQGQVELKDISLKHSL